MNYNYEWIGGTKTYFYLAQYLETTQVKIGTLEIHKYKIHLKFLTFNNGLIKLYPHDRLTGSHYILYFKIIWEDMGNAYDTLIKKQITKYINIEDTTV